MKKQSGHVAKEGGGGGGKKDDSSSTTPPSSSSTFDPFNKLREAYSSSLDVAGEETPAGAGADSVTASNASERRRKMEECGEKKSWGRRKKKKSANEGDRRQGQGHGDEGNGTVGGNANTCTAKDDGTSTTAGEAGEDCGTGDVGGGAQQQQQNSIVDAADDDPFLRLRESYKSSVELVADTEKVDSVPSGAGAAAETGADDVDKKEEKKRGRNDKIKRHGDGSSGGRAAERDGREKRHKKKKSKRKHRDKIRSKKSKKEENNKTSRDRGDVEMRPLVDFDGVNNDDDDDDLELAIFGSRRRGGDDDNERKFSMEDYGFDEPDDVWLAGLKVACVAVLAISFVAAVRTPNLSDKLHHAVRGFMPRGSVVDYYKDNDAYDVAASSSAEASTLKSPQSSSEADAQNENRRDVKIPERYRDTLAELYEPYDDLTDTPLYWHIAKNAGTTFQHYVDHCLGLVDASQIGITDGHEDDKMLQIYQHDDGGLFVNVDTTTPAGISRAKSMGLAESGFADVIFTSLIYDAARLFTPQHRGRMFALFRHPVDRAVSLYYHLREAKWGETYDPLLKGVTIEEFATRSQTEHNWMTRFLAGVDGGNLYEKHLDVAKEILRTRCLVGLVSELEVSLDRFQRYFGWTLEGEGSVGCHWEHVKTGYNVRDHPPLERDSEAYIQLERRNYFDVQLYEYVEQLFKEQSQLF